MDASLKEYIIIHWLMIDDLVPSMVKELNCSIDNAIDLAKQVHLKGKAGSRTIIIEVNKDRVSICWEKGIK